MPGALLVACVAGALVASGALWAACLRCRSPTAYLLATYVAIHVQVLLSALALSTVHAFDRVGLVLSAAFWIGCAAVVWRSTGRPAVPSFRSRLCRLLPSVRESPIALLAATTAAAYAYLIVVGLATPQNDGDPLVYQLGRAALWKQHEAIGIVGTSVEPRLDVNPIVAEVGQATTMILAGSERFVWLVPMSAVLALAVGAFALARRVGLDPRAALFGALVVPLLPVILMQASSGLNDLVVASFLVAAAVFALGTQRVEIALVGVAIALALATKFTAPFLLPLPALVVVFGQPFRRWLAYGLSVSAGIALGSWWYIVNLVRTGRLDGGLADFAHQEAYRTLGGVGLNANRLVLDALELPGIDGWAPLVFVVVGGGIAAAALTPGRLRSMPRTHLVLSGALVALAPLVLEAQFTIVAHVTSAVWRAAGNTGAPIFWVNASPNTLADGTDTWYGLLAVSVGLLVVVIVIAQRRLQRAALALALAPVLGLAALASALSYDPFRGRFLMGAAVMNVSLWGLTLRWRVAALAIAVVTALSAGLCLVNYLEKPSGIAIGSRPLAPSIWALPRWQAQTLLRGELGEQTMIRTVEEQVPQRAAIATALWGNDFLLPYFGPSLERTVEVIEPDGLVPRTADWIVIAPPASPRGCAGSWETAAKSAGWMLLRRMSADSCASRGPIKRPPGILPATLRMHVVRAPAGEPAPFGPVRKP